MGVEGKLMIQMPINPFLRIGAMLLLLAAWMGFMVLLSFGLVRVRQFPGFQNFLTFIPNPSQVNVMVATVAPAIPQSSNVVIVPTIAPQVSNPNASGRGNVAIVPPAAPAVISYPTRCEHSVETRLYVGANGYTSFDPLVRLRLSPGADAGTRLAGGTQFVITGEPRCANLYGYSWNNYLWWPVRLTSGSASGDTGWLPESMISEGRTVILMYLN